MVRFRKQIGALPWRRRRDEIEILLITSRETKRWVIPKGWPMPELSDSNAARREAFEEAGVAGRVRRTSVGSYTYDKRLNDGGTLACRVQVFPLLVVEKHKTWPEQDERKRQWFERSEAAFLVDEPGLQELIRDFDPRG
jgi:8-oxo-dGTP pyrophosphatase MutT (NUDIX family)